MDDSLFHQLTVDDDKGIKREIFFGQFRKPEDEKAFFNVIGWVQDLCRTNAVSQRIQTNRNGENSKLRSLAPKRLDLFSIRMPNTSSDAVELGVSDIPASTERVIRKLHIGMKEADAVSLMRPVCIDWGRLTYGGTGAGRLYFQISSTQQLWLASGGANSDWTLTAISAPDPKSKWTRHGTRHYRRIAAPTQSPPMTMQHIPRSFKIGLAIRHPNIDPAEITRSLELAPTRVTRVGAPRTTPTGNPLPGTYEFSHWSHQFDLAGALELGVILQDLLKGLRVHRSFFHGVVQESGTVELFCGIFTAGNWDEILSHSLMSQLADLKIDLRLDVYPKDGDVPAVIN